MLSVQNWIYALLFLEMFVLYTSLILFDTIYSVCSLRRGEEPSGSWGVGKQKPARSC